MPRLTVNKRGRQFERECEFARVTNLYVVMEIVHMYLLPILIFGS